MYVCICHAVSDTDLKRCMNDAPCSYGEVCKRLGIGSQCGRCEQSVRDMMSGMLPVIDNACQPLNQENSLERS